MAAAAERLLLGSSVTDVWLIGEDVILWDLFGDALRDMADPPSYGDPDHYSGTFFSHVLFAVPALSNPGFLIICFFE